MEGGDVGGPRNGGAKKERETGPRKKRDKERTAENTRGYGQSPPRMEARPMDGVRNMGPSHVNRAHNDSLAKFRARRRDANLCPSDPDTCARID